VGLGKKEDATLLLCNVGRRFFRCVPIEVLKREGKMGEGRGEERVRREWKRNEREKRRGERKK
jgi:hypothetical protein